MTDAALFIGWGATQGGRERKAVELFATAIDKRKEVNRGVDDYLTAHGSLASTLSKLGRHQQAVEEWMAAAEILRAQFPHLAQQHLPTTYCLAAQDWLAMNKPAEALHCVEEAQKLDPANAAAAEIADKARRMLASVPTD